MLMEAINSQLCKLYDSLSLYGENDKVHLMLKQSIDGYQRLLARIQGR